MKRLTIVLFLVIAACGVLPARADAQCWSASCITKIAQSATERVTTIGKSATRSAATILEDAAEVIEETAEDSGRILRKAVDGAESAIDYVGDGAESVIDYVGDGAESVIDGAQSIIEDTCEKIGHAFTEIAPGIDTKDLGQEMAVIGTVAGLAIAPVACGPGAPLCASATGAAGGATGSVVGSCIEGKLSGYVQVVIPLDSAAEAGSQTRVNSNASPPPLVSSVDRTPSGRTKGNRISASDLSEASVTALREIDEIRDLGSLTQKVAIFGIGVQLLDNLSHPAKGLALLMDPPGVDVYVGGLTAIDRLTACSVRDRIQWRVLHAQTRRKEKWKTDEERQYFRMLQEQSQRICSRR